MRKQVGMSAAQAMKPSNGQHRAGRDYRCYFCGLDIFKGELLVFVETKAGQRRRHPGCKPPLGGGTTRGRHSRGPRAR